MNIQPSRIVLDDIPENSTEGSSFKSFYMTQSSGVHRDVSFKQPFFFDGIMIGLCQAGSGKVTVNFRDYEVKAGSVMIILPKNIVRGKKNSDDFKMEIMLISHDMIADMSFSKFGMATRMARLPLLEIPPETMENLLEISALINKHYNARDKPHREHIVKGLLYSMIMEVGSAYAMYGGNDDGGKISNRKEELAERFFRLLAENYQTDRSVTFYADKMCLTPKYLSATVKSVTGHPILDWINLAVIAAAKTRLKTTDLTVLQISEELNFPNPSFFGRFFKKHVGVTPYKYRNS